MPKPKYYPKWLRASLKSDKEHLFIDMDGVTCDFDGAKKAHVDGGGKPNDVFKMEGFFTDLPAIVGAIEAIQKLDKVYDVYMLSTAPWSSPNAWKEKRIWVENYLGVDFKKKLILSHNKGLFKGRALIDDRVANGVLDFDGEHIHFGEEGFETWDKVVEYLL